MTHPQPIAMHELFRHRVQTRKGRAPMTQSQKARTASHIRRIHGTQAALDQLESARRCGNTERATLILSVMADLDAKRKEAHEAALAKLRQNRERIISLRPSWRPIAEAVAKKHRMGVREMLDRYRSRRVVIARQAFWAELRQRGFSFSEIGRRTGGYNHTTVLYGVRQHEARTAPQVSNNGVP